MADVGAESMVGGTTFHREVIEREISRTLVLNLSGNTTVLKTPREKFVLDRVFALIEGHPLCPWRKHGPAPLISRVLQSGPMSELDDKIDASRRLLEKIDREYAAEIEKLKKEKAQSDDIQVAYSNWAGDHDQGNK
jgi:hypothetical protein